MTDMASIFSCLDLLFFKDFSCLCTILILLLNILSHQLQILQGLSKLPLFYVLQEPLLSNIYILEWNGYQR